MNRVILILLVIFSTITFWGQSYGSCIVNGKYLSEIKVPFIEVQICKASFSRKVNILVDYGQENGTFSRNSRLLRDKNGNDVRFESNIAALNFLIGSGYELVHIQYFQDSTGSQTGNVTLLLKNNSFWPESVKE